jgi:transposase
MRALSERIIKLDREFEALAWAEPGAYRLRTVPGIGALNATALAAAVGDGSMFAKGRDFAAWLGTGPDRVHHVAASKAEKAGNISIWPSMITPGWPILKSCQTKLGAPV